jgi:CHAT domain-containing protein
MVSLDEAKEISLQFSDASFVPPPRSIKDLKLDNCTRLIGEFLNNYTSKSLSYSCTSRSPSSLKQISENLRDAPAYPDLMSKVRVLQRLARDELDNGRYSRSIQLLEMSIKSLPPEVRGGRGNRYAKLASYYAYAGDIKSANKALRKALRWYAQTKYHDAWKEYYLYSAKAQIEQLNGNLDRAEQYFKIAITAIQPVGGLSRNQMKTQVDLIENLQFQGRSLEAEVLARELVRYSGLVHPDPRMRARALTVLSQILFMQGRYNEAEYVANCASVIFTIYGADCSSLFLNRSRQMMAKSLMAQEQWKEAIEHYETILKGLENEPDLLKARFAGDVDWAIALLSTGKVFEAIENLEIGHEFTVKQFGQNHYHTAVIRGVIAAAYAANGDKNAALKGFAEAVPIILEKYREVRGKTLTRISEDKHLVFIVESYMNLLANISDTPLETKMGLNIVDSSFTLADFLRVSSVQRVVTACAARYAMKNSELADVVRREQDAEKYLDALHSALANAVAQLRTDQNLEVIQSLREKIDNLNKARLTFLKEIKSRFPKYDQLINPIPPSLKDARKSLKPGESLLSIYNGRYQSFVWAVPSEGNVVFATVPLGKKEIDLMVDQIRSTLEPKAKTLGQIPQFDLDTAYELFRAFFEPVREGWENAKSLLVVPHGAFNYLPISLLPTKKLKLPADEDVFFRNYQKVPWLIKSYAVTVFPSVSTLMTLRTMTEGDRAHLPFVGFGDPYFSEQQAIAAAKSIKEPQKTSYKQTGDYGLRGLSIQRIKTDHLDSAQLEILPRLPETAEEIQSMALAMNANPDRDVFIGAQANEQQVKKMDLSQYKVIAFATHGLAPGDLDGLLQPALALSSPKVAGIDGDGLLKMEEIFSLWLNADWVVLSACNTGAVKEHGTEALSGLCRAFFYAGARALLVTNWPVETNSAKALTTDLFMRQAKNPMFTRAEALRQSILFLIDKGSYIDPVSGKMAFSYAHPIFWAAFSLVGG